jgi:MerR family copper efflux transcriptional regulator
VKISDVAKRTGLDAKTIRYYESIGLVNAPPRRENGYREYNEQGIQELGFIQKARKFGFSISECRELLTLWGDPSRCSADVHALLAEKVKGIEQHIQELRVMKKLLSELLDKCPGDNSFDCAIINKLALNED